MSSNKESKAIKKEKIISRVVMLYLIPREQRALMNGGGGGVRQRERCEQRLCDLSAIFHWKKREN